MCLHVISLTTLLITYVSCRIYWVNRFSYNATLPLQFAGPLWMFLTSLNSRLFWNKTKNYTPWPESASELYRSSDRRLSANLVPTFADRGCHVVSVTDPYGRTLGFLDRSRYIFFQAVPQLYSRGWVDPVPDPLLLRKSGSAGNRTWTSGSVARNSDHQTTEAIKWWTHHTNYNMSIRYVLTRLAYKTGTEIVPRHPRYIDRHSIQWLMNKEL
jgi:hypothetical protein